MVVSLCQKGLGQPTKTNTNNNTRPVIHLHFNISQPSSAGSSIHHPWIARWAGNNVAKVVGSSPTRGTAFFIKKSSNLPKQLILLSRLAYGLGWQEGFQDKIS